MAAYFITGPEGSGTTALVQALTNHPSVVKGDAARYGHVSLHASAGAQLLPAALMSTHRAHRFDLADPEGARRLLRANSAALLAAQPGTKAIFFKYSTPAFRPLRLWPVFLPLFELPDFRTVVIWRHPLDSIHSAFRRFYQGRHPVLGFLAAARSHLWATRHIRWQLARSPRDRYVSLRYEALVGRPEATLRALYAFADLDYCPAERLLPGRGFSNENGKWKESLRKAIRRATPAPGRDQ